MKKLFLLIGIVLLPFLAQAQINQQNVTRILKALSADELKGRQAFSPEIREAAGFISDEFSDIGLKPLKEEDDFFQKFKIESITLDKSAVTVGNNTVPESNYFAIVNNEDVSWSGSEDITVTQIKAGDNFQSKFSEINALEKDLVVFVDPSHADMFDRYKPYFSRATRNFPDEARHNKIFILEEEADTFVIKLRKKVDKPELTNVAGMLEGKRKDEIVLFSAHYDHIGVIQPVENDSIANGANDNASGTTAVIELARHFSKKDQPERTLMFVAFTAEEVGGFGSQYFSRQLDPDNITAMFNIEMIGKPDTEGPNSAWITGFDKSSFGELLQKSTEGSQYTFYADPYPNQNLFYRSDNATLARLGVPAHTISTTPIDVDKDYHQVSDEFDTINVEHLTNTINAIAKAARGIVSGEDTPTRVDKATVN